MIRGGGFAGKRHNAADGRIQRRKSQPQKAQKGSGFIAAILNVRHPIVQQLLAPM
jgi:hypothetical protein